MKNNFLLALLVLLFGGVNAQTIATDSIPFYMTENQTAYHSTLVNEGMSGAAQAFDNHLLRVAIYPFETEQSFLDWDQIKSPKKKEKERLAQEPKWKKTHKKEPVPTLSNFPPEALVRYIDEKTGEVVSSSVRDSGQHVDSTSVVSSKEPVVVDENANDFVYVTRPRPSEKVPVTLSLLRNFKIDLEKDSARIQLFLEGSLRFTRHTASATIENGKLVITNTPYVVPMGTRCEVKVFKKTKLGLPRIFVSPDSTGTVPVLIPFQFIVEGKDTVAVLDWGTTTDPETGEEFNYFESGDVIYEIMSMPENGTRLNFEIEYDNQQEKYARGDNPGTVKKSPGIKSPNGAVYEPVERSDAWRSKIGSPINKKSG